MLPGETLAMGFPPPPGPGPPLENVTKLFELVLNNILSFSFYCNTHPEMFNWKKREITNIVLVNSHPVDVPASIFHTTWMGCYIIELQQGTSVPSSRQVWKVTKVSHYSIACSALASIDVRRFIKRWFCRGWLSGLLNADLKNDLRVPSWSIVLQNVHSWHPSSPSWRSRSSVSVALLACGPVGQYFKKFYQQIVVWSWKSKQSKGTLQHVSS